MKFRLGLAFFIAIISIGVASLHRFSTLSNAKLNTATLEIVPNNNYEEGFLEDFLEPKSVTATTEVASKPITNTDLIGRGLVMDYVKLAGNGQLSSQELKSLADKYVENLPPQAPTPATTYNNLKIVANAKANFQTYDDQMTIIHRDFANAIVNSYGNDTDLASLNEPSTAFMSAFGQAYKNAATRMQSVPAPTALAALHLELINNYLTNSISMGNVSKLDADPATAFASLVTFKTNLDRQSVINAEIEKIMKANGV